MNNLVTLVKMQLKEKLDLKRLRLERSNLFSLLVSVVWEILKLAMIIGVFAVLILLINYIGVFSSVKRLPDTVMSIAFGIMLLASVISCTLSLTKSMYFSRDNAILLTLPCRPVQVYLSKMIIFFAYELKRNLSFMAPLFIAYYITHSYPLIAYPWMLICFFFVSLFTVALASLLSIPTMWVSNFFRQNRYLQIGTLAAIVTIVVVSLFYAVSLIPENLDLLAQWPTITLQIRDGLNNYAESFRPFYDMTLMFLGEVYDIIHVSFPIGATLLRFIILVAITAVLLLLSMLIVLPLFYKMASKPFEYLKKQVKPRKNRVHNKLVTTFLTEMTMSVKDPARIFCGVGILISIPLLTFLLNKIFFAMNTDEMGSYMVVAFNLLIILLISLNANTGAASVYSRDGRSAYLIKTQPTNPSLILFSKLIPEGLFCLTSLLATLVILLISAKLGVINTVFLMLGVIFIYLAHLFYCAELDIMNPQYEIYATVGASDSNPNETKSTVSAFIISFLVAGVSMLLLIDNSSAIGTINLGGGLSLDTVYLKLFLAGLAAMAYRIYLFFNKIKLYYKEK